MYIEYTFINTYTGVHTGGERPGIAILSLSPPPPQEFYITVTAVSN